MIEVLRDGLIVNNVILGTAVATVDDSAHSRASIQYRLSLTLRLNELAGENRHELCTAFETELLSGLLPQLGVSFR